MELIKKNIHMTQQRMKAVGQITIDNDSNVPDNKQDIEKIILDKGEVGIEEIKSAQDHATVRGDFQFCVLYSSDSGERSIHSLCGRIPFEEVLNMDGLTPSDLVDVKYEIEDFTVDIVNSRKLNIKAIITLYATVDGLYDEEVVTDAREENGLQTKKSSFPVLQVAVHKKDTCRIRDEIVLPSNKSNIYELLWSSIQPRNIEIKRLDNQLSIHGELLVFAIYTSEDENHPLQMVEETIPFHNVVECSGCAEEMIPEITWEMTKKDMEVKPDYDGEERVFGIESVLEFEIKLFDEEEAEAMVDVYSTTEEAIPIMGEVAYQKLLTKNFSKSRTADRLRVQDNQERIMQIAHTEGQAKVEDIEVTENGLEIEGIIMVQILYVTPDDSVPLATLRGVVPFQQTVEVPGLNEDSEYFVQTDLEQLSATMVDSDEIEIKASVNLNNLVLNRETIDVVKNIEILPLDMERLQELPGIVGYIADGQKTLWEVAKEHATTIEEIQQVNAMKSDELKRGDKLIIIKSVGQPTGAEY